MGNKNYLQSSGRYTAEALEALKGNAIHIAANTKSNSETIKEEAKEATQGDTEAKDLTLSEEEGENGDISLPDKEEILAARRKREIMRKMGTDAAIPSYIPLSGKDGGNTEKSDKKIYGLEDDDEHGGLVSENPDDEEQDVFEDRKGSRILMHDPGKEGTGRIDSEAKQAIRKAHQEDEDDEYQRWIDDKIRKGGARVAKSQPYVEMITDAKGTGIKKYRPAQRRQVFDVAREMKRLQSALVSLKEDAAKVKRDVSRVDTELKLTKSELEKHEQALNGMNKQYLFYQTLRDKIADCLDCLNTKAPLIEEAMEEMKELRLSKAKAIRRLQDLHIRDEADAAFEKAHDVPKEKQVDEFGRDIGGAVEKGRQARAELRKRRRAKLGIEKLGSKEEAFWTEDEAELGAQYAERRKRLLEDVKAIFLDADDDFKTIDAVKEKLEQLKRRYPQAYTDTYISLSVPSLFAPYVRMELMNWRFLEHPKFEAMEWYNKLAEYGMFGDIKEDDPDLDVIPRLIEKVVTPYITDFFFTEWDPLSSKLFPAVSSLVKEVLDHVDGKLPNPQKLLSTILDRYSHMVNVHSKVPIVPEKSDKLDAQWTFCQFQWWRALKLLKELLRWKNILSAEVIRDLSISHLIDNMVPFLNKEMKTKPIRVNLVIQLVKEIQSTLPQEWLDNKGPAKKLRDIVKEYGRLCSRSGVSTKNLAAINSLLR